MLLLVLAIYLAGFGTGLDAATITAPSCNQADVQNAIEQAADGDTVLVPAGSSTWTSGISISKTLVLKGAGIGRTLITNNFPEGSLVNISESTTGHIRIRFHPGYRPRSAPDFLHRCELCV
jgi:hypothetical protein